MFEDCLLEHFFSDIMTEGVDGYRENFSVCSAEESPENGIAREFFLLGAPEKDQR
jgi:hypothetical protein